MHARPVLRARYGIFNPLGSSVFSGSAINGKKTEFLVHGSVGLQASLFNATVQGGLFNDDGGMDLSALNNPSYNASLGTMLRWNRLSATFSYEATTGVLKSTETHAYGSFSLGYMF